MSHEFSPVRPVDASGPGALAGFRADCSCGFMAVSSCRSIVELDIVDHVAWVARVERDAARYDASCSCAGCFNTGAAR